MYDVVVIGAGSAGLAAQKEIVKKTDNYLVISADPLGTTCARVGCMPSKALIEAANIYHQNYKFEQIGVMGAESLHLNDQRLMEHVRALRDHFVKDVLAGMEKWSDKLLKGVAKITGPHSLEVNGQKIEFKKLIIATGSSPVIPEAWRHLKDRILTSDNFFELDKMPKRLAVIGAGPVGLEIAQALGRLDVEVFLFADGDTMGGLTDPEVVKTLREQIAKDVFYVHQNVSDLKWSNDCFQITTEGSTHTVDGVLLALGRQPNVKNMGLEKLGVPLNEKGLPEFSPKSLRIKDTDAYLAGDVSSLSPLLHEAVDEGRIAGFNAVREKDDSFERRTRISITYSHPGCGVAGKTFADLQKAGVEFKTGTVSFEKQGRAMTQLDAIGRLNVYGDPKSGDILGAEIFAPGAEHLTHMLAWSIDAKSSVFDLLGKPFYHPTIEEGLRTALRNLAKQVPKSCHDFDLVRCDDMPVAP